jgi:UDP-N-acetylmuramate dehydrogenase
MSFSKIKNITRVLGIKNAILNCDTSKLCSIGAGGTASALITVDDEKMLLNLIEALECKRIKYIVLGDGTNTIFGDGFIDYVIVRQGNSFNNIKIGTKEIEAGAAVKTSRLVSEAARGGFDLSFMAGIPGTAGGAICGNSGSRGMRIVDFIKSLRYLSVNKNNFCITGCDRRDIKSGYRYFDIPGMVAIISAVFEPHIEDSSILEKKIKENNKLRKITQPVGMKTSGCFFKNSEGTNRSAGALIDECGLKGFMYGGARVSPIHANFIENYKKASAGDIMVLSRIVKKMVEEKHDVELEYEIRYVG